MVKANQNKIAVIGSGFGGLAAAIRLQAAGFKVKILEKRDKPGGRAYVYHDKGYTFDAGPTVITAPHCLEELFEVSGKKSSEYIELLPVKPLYRLSWEDGTSFDYSQDLEETLAQIRALPGSSEQDVHGYKEFLKYTSEVFEEGYTKLAHVPFLRIWDMVRVSPQLLRLKAYRTVYNRVAHYLKEPHLRQAFSFHSLLVGGNPFQASSIYTLIHFLERKWGVYFPKGGTHALVRSLVQLFKDLGGEIEYGYEVERIVTENSKVVGVSGSRRGFEPFDAVVSNADVARTYQDLLAEEPAAFLNRAWLKRARFSMSLFVLYFGTKKQYPEMAHHNVLFCSRYKELLDDIFKTGKLADDFSLYLHAPSRTDASLAPPGGEAFYVLSPVPHLGKLNVDWDEVGPKYAQRILEYLEERYLPGLRSEIVTQRYFSPLEFKNELNATMGSAFSLEPLLRQSAYFRVHNRDKRIGGLYFVGAGTHPGAGIPGVVNSAKATASLVMNDFAPVKVFEKPKLEILATQIASDSTAVAARCQEMIRKGSKSFSAASLLLDPERRRAAHELYAWCRYCDDQMDDESDFEKRMEKSNLLVFETEAALKGHPSNKLVFQALARVCSEYQIPKQYPMTLLEGMKMDSNLSQIADEKELDLYCHRVAGVVGLMMSHVMGVNHSGALSQAEAMGSAMQMTNIARDIREDWMRGRVYLPRTWFEEMKVDASILKDPAQSHVSFALVRRLLAVADRRYQWGREGTLFLAPRAAVSIAVASYVYQGIGRKILRIGPEAINRRVYLTVAEKALAFFKGFWFVARQLPKRWGQPWVPVQIKEVWSPQ